MTREQLVHAVDEEIAKLQRVRTLLAGGKVHAKRHLSAEARERIAAAQRKRWAKQKRAA